MQERMAVRVNEVVGKRIARKRKYDVLERIDPGPDSYVSLRYEDHKNPEYVRVVAINRHPTKTIRVCFYTLHESGGSFLTDKFKGRTIRRA